MLHFTRFKNILMLIKVAQQEKEKLVKIFPMSYRLICQLSEHLKYLS